MRRRVTVIVALVLASIFLIAGGVVGRDALAAYFDLQPHSCGGG
jgi:hypothetical protein